MAKRRADAAGPKPGADEPFPPAWVEVDDPIGRSVRRAAEEGRADVLAFLIGREVDLDAVEDFEEPTALMIAAEAGRADLVALLVNAGADPTRLDRDGEAPLMIAARRGDRGIFDLLAPGIDPARRAEASRVLDARERSNRPDPGKARASLLKAVVAGQVDAVRQALAGGADPEARDSDGISTLQRAGTLADGLLIVEALVEAGANPDARDENGSAAIFFARTEPVIAFLVRAGADPDAARLYGKTPLHEAAARGEPDRIGWLVAAGARVDAVADEGETPLHSAASNRQPKAFARLVELGATIDRTDHRGRTPIDLARASFARPEDRPALARLKKALVAGGHLDGRPDALIAAIIKQKSKVVAKLLAEGVEVNTPGDLPGRHGVTALYVAATGGDATSVNQLLEAGADPRLKNSIDRADPARRLDGATPREGAIAHGHIEIADLLERAEASQAIP